MTETHGIDTTPTPGDEARTLCPRCAGTNGNHGEVHVRHGNGGGHNEPCPNAPPPDGQARADAERLYPDPGVLTDWERRAYVRGRADERARIAAQRDKAVQVLASHDSAPFLAANVSREERHAVARVLVDAALAALGMAR